MKKKLLISAFFTILLLSFTILLSIPSNSYNVPNSTVAYTLEQTEPIVISESSSVKFSGVNISVSDISENTSAVKICNSSAVNLIFEGTNSLTGNENLVGAGIYVEEGSSVTIYGLENSSLNVRGGKYSAGIGGIGCPSAATTNPKAGSIFIKSGNIIAVGGAKGAGIGSGYHSSCSDITIFGGDITAFGTECGAGIGSGYATSGGAYIDSLGNPTASGVGFYDAGNITISGGTVKAASYNVDFNHLNPYDRSTLYVDKNGNNYTTGSFAAGIGGGYGSSGGNIVINGTADVMAVGGCGGAGIGSGRGTSKIANYDEANFFSNITIAGNSKILAMATDDLRNNQGGGAAIGSGRGCGTAGVIKILENANVTAVASPYAAAIGGSWKVGAIPFTNGLLNEGASEMNALPQIVEIGPDTIISAVSDGYRSAVSLTSNVQNFSSPPILSLNFEQSFFQSRSDYFSENIFPVTVRVCSQKSDDITQFALYDFNKSNAVLYAPGVDIYQFKIIDIYNNEKIYISNEKEDNSASFKTTSEKDFNWYEITNLTSPINQEKELKTATGDLKLKIKAPEGIFEYKSVFFCDEIQDKSTIEELNSQLDKEYSDVLERILYFDVGVKKHDGKNFYSGFKGGKVELYVPIPQGWDKTETKVIFVTPETDENFESTQKLEIIDNMDYLVFQTDHFSDYVLFDPLAGGNSESDFNELQSESLAGESEAHNKDPNSKYLDILPTGSKVVGIMATILLAALSFSVAMYFVIRSRK